ncbi:epidermal growth factor-like protein 7 isoform X6 [Manis javanica]|uniref:epidermal growth factor-like protein 7 isoform X6 n=1 Tax=Manis javanica TaxID=9974 RepID=UPI003C6D9F0D
MWGPRKLLLLWCLVLAAGGTEHIYRPGRRVCAIRVPRGPLSESFAQRVYQPFLTTCDGHRACSTYRTIYRTAYRRSPGAAPARPRYACCPGWKRSTGLPGACGAGLPIPTAICQPPCQNGGSCVQPGRCHCPAGWRGSTCQTDVDECSAGGGSCPQRCVNTVGSYWCQCPEGYSPAADGTLCSPRRGTPGVAPSPRTGVDGQVEEEVQRLRSRVDLLEQQVSVLKAGWGRLTGPSPPPGPLHAPEAAVSAGPAAQPGLAGPGARAPGPWQPAGPLLPAAGPHRLSERADLLPGGAAGVLFLREGAVTGLARAPGVGSQQPMDSVSSPSPDCGDCEPSRGGRPLSLTQGVPAQGRVGCGSSTV